VIYRLAAAFPWLSDAVLSAPARGWLPDGILHHRVTDEVLQRSVRRSILSKINGEPFWVPAVAASFYRRFEETTVAFLKAELHDGNRFVNVGANIGYLTIVASRCVGSAGEVHAIEPGPANLRLLDRNLARYRCRNVIVHRLAIGEVEGNVTFRATKDQLEDSTTVEPFSDVIATFEVPQTRLDSLLEPPIDLIKIDVQGGELSVLRSMGKLIEESPRLTVIVEWEPRYLARAQHRPEDLLDVLSDLGLSPKFVIDDHSGQCRSVSDMLEVFTRTPTTYGNLVARRPPR
jgi:FkbM family methyltransferase